MMRMSRKPLRLESAQSYYLTEIDSANYYTENQSVSGEWYGKGAAALGIAGEVTPEAFTAALQGLNPNTGEVVVNASARGVRVPGWDLALSCPKSVSIMALVGGDRRLIEAHNRAVDQTLPEVERFALAFQHGGREHVVTGNNVIARFNHFAARPGSNGVPDPHLHTHSVILNMTRRPDDQWRSLVPIEEYRCQSYGSALYLSNLAVEVQKLGYQTINTSNYGAWELQGFTREQVLAFSQRKKDVLAYMAEHGLGTYISSTAGQIGLLHTRSPKEHTDKWTLEAGWRQRARDNGIPLNQHLNEALKRGSVASTPDQQTIQIAVEFARTHTTERQAVVDVRQLQEFSLEHGMGKLRLGDVRSQITAEQTLGKLVLAGDTEQSHKVGAGRTWDRSWHPGGAFTTDEMLKLERENLELVRAGARKAMSIGNRTDIAIWALDKGLLPDQIGVAQATLSSADWVTAIEAAAGTGKTHAVGAIREYAEQQGYTVRGFGMSSTAVETLQDAGVNSQTIASLLASQLPVPEERELWIVDESSLLDTRKANALLKAAREQGVARIVFVGDQKQHKAIEAGAPVLQFLRDNLAVATLHEIKRQKDPELRRAAELARDKPADALALFEEQQRVTEIPEAEARYKRIALDYLRAHEAGQTVLVVSPANEERKDLNHEIRQLLVAQGQVSKDAREHAILVSRDFTKAQRQHAGSYREGDVIHFRRKACGIAAGSYLTVAGVDWESNTLTLHGRDGAQINFDPSSMKAFQVYNWEEREIAVGDRIQFTVHDKKNGIVNRSFATIRELDNRQATLVFDNGREYAMPLAQFRHFDLGYCTTSHSSQGKTVDKVIANIDTLRSDLLVNHEQFYVTASRGALDAQIYTDDKNALRKAVVRERQKEIAIDALAQQRTQLLQQQPQQSAAMSIKI